MSAPPPDPDEWGTLSRRERAILADIATELSSDRELTGRMSRRHWPLPAVWSWAARIVLLVVLLAALAGAVYLFPRLPVVGIGILTVGTTGPWLVWCSVTPGRRRAS